MTPAPMADTGADAGADALADRLAVLEAKGRHIAPPQPGLGAIALALTAEDPDRIVLSQAGRDLTRYDMVAMACRLGGALQARGVKKGARIAFQLPNWWEAAVINMACALFG